MQGKTHESILHIGAIEHVGGKRVKTSLHMGAVFRSRVAPFRTAAPLRGQTTQTLSGLSPK